MNMENIIELRSVLACSQEQLADIIDVSTYTISRWERTKKTKIASLSKQRVIKLKELSKRVASLFDKTEKDDVISKWFHQENRVLKGDTPIDFLRKKGNNIEYLEALIDRLELGIPE